MSRHQDSTPSPEQPSASLRSPAGFLSAKALEPLPRVTDFRPWAALAVVGAGLTLAMHQWPWVRWPMAVLLLLALMRAMGFVLAANSLGKDPEKEQPSASPRKADGPA